MKKIEKNQVKALTINHQGNDDYRTKARHRRSHSDVTEQAAASVKIALNTVSEMADHCATQVETLAKQVWDTDWKALTHNALPHWMKDNEYLLTGYRPPLPSFKACLASMFRMHTETINIWTHFIGAIIFCVLYIFFLFASSSDVISLNTKIVVSLFFFGAISCLFCSTIFHIFACHSCEVCKIFNKIDYCGISMLLIGSFVPWLYHAFYSRYTEMVFYMIVLVLLGIICIYVSLIDKFSTPAYRSTRAAVFILFGLSAVIPCCHHMYIFGVYNSFKYASITWLILMGTLYIIGALLYANRIPERFFPGKFDIWGQSHQLFHVFVVLAAAVHYYGIITLASNHHFLTALSEMS